MTYEELIEKLTPTLKRITYKINGHLSFLDHEDLFQEALIHLWEEFNQGTLTDKTDSYILQGCFFHLKNYLRKVRAKPILISIDKIINENGLTLGENLSSNEAHSEDLLNHLNDELLAEDIRNNGLKPREKKILEYFAQGLTTREIGKHCGVSHVRIVKIMSGIREKCRKHIDRD